MARTNGKSVAPDPAPVVEPAAAPVITPRDPKRTIGVETATGINYEPAPDADWQFDRRITLRGQNHEHTSTDPDGVWIYRSM